MRVRFLFVFIFLGAMSFQAQNNLIIVNESGEPFWLEVDTIRVNDLAQDIVQLKHIGSDTCLLKICFPGKKSADFTDKVFLLDNGKSCKNKIFSYSMEARNGKYKLRYVASYDLLIDSIGQIKRVSEQVKKFYTTYLLEQNTIQRSQENYPNPGTCETPTNDTLINAQVRLLQLNHIELNRIKDAKWFISNNCMQVSQALKILQTFDYDDSKLKIAQFAYPYIQDKDNFMNFIAGFKYKTEKEKLKAFYAQQKDSAVGK